VTELGDRVDRQAPATRTDPRRRGQPLQKGVYVREALGAALQWTDHPVADPGVEIAVECRLEERELRAVGVVEARAREAGCSGQLRDRDPGVAERQNSSIRRSYNGILLERAGVTRLASCFEAVIAERQRVLYSAFQNSSRIGGRLRNACLLWREEDRRREGTRMSYVEQGRAPRSCFSTVTRHRLPLANVMPHLEGWDASLPATWSAWATRTSWTHLDRIATAIASTATTYSRFGTARHRA